MSPERITAATNLTLAGARALGRQRLAGSSDTPGLDADVLVQHVTGSSRVDLIAHPDTNLTPQAESRYRELLDRRAAGEPVAYLTGRKSFRGIELYVDCRVLVPRPETELMVDVALTVLGMGSGRRRVIDIGTGSGAIALSLVYELLDEPESAIEIVASDISQDALQVAARNRDELGLGERVILVQSDLLEDVEGSFDLILANLPYLRDDQRHPSTASEPEGALYAGPDGLDDYRRLLTQVAYQLNPGGVLVFEIDPDQTATMMALVGHHIEGDAVVLKDLAGRERLVVAGPVDIVRTVAETWPYGA